MSDNRMLDELFNRREPKLLMYHGAYYFQMVSKTAINMQHNFIFEIRPLNTELIRRRLAPNILDLYSESEETPFIEFMMSLLCTAPYDLYSMKKQLFVNEKESFIRIMIKERPETTWWDDRFSSSELLTSPSTIKYVSAQNPTNIKYINATRYTSSAVCPTKPVIQFRLDMLINDSESEWGGFNNTGMDYHNLYMIEVKPLVDQFQKHLLGCKPVSEYMEFYEDFTVVVEERRLVVNCIIYPKSVLGVDIRFPNSDDSSDEHMYLNEEQLGFCSSELPCLDLIAGSFNESLIPLASKCNAYGVDDGITWIRYDLQPADDETITNNYFVVSHPDQETIRHPNTLVNLGTLHPLQIIHQVYEDKECVLEFNTLNKKGKILLPSYTNDGIVLGLATYTFGEVLPVKFMTDGFYGITAVEKVFPEEFLECIIDTYMKQLDPKNNLINRIDGIALVTIRARPNSRTFMLIAKYPVTNLEPKDVIVPIQSNKEMKTKKGLFSSLFGK